MLAKGQFPSVVVKKCYMYSIRGERNQNFDFSCCGFKPHGHPKQQNPPCAGFLFGYSHALTMKFSNHLRKMRISV